MVLFSLTLLASTSAQAPAEAQDAKTLLQWYADHAATREQALAALAAGKPGEAAFEHAREELEWAAYVFLQAGAAGELTALLDRLEPMLGDTPSKLDLERFRIQMACWSPDLYQAGLALARQWPAAGLTPDAASLASVTAMRDYLEQQLATRASIQARGKGLLRYAFPAALLMAAAGLWVALRLS